MDEKNNCEKATFIVIPNNSDYLKKAQKYGQITG